MRLWRALVCGLAVLSAGCASLPAPDAAINISVARYHQTIAINGRLSLRYQQQGREQTLHGSFVWNQTPEHTVLTLLSPLGQTLASIDIDATRATLTQAGQATRSAADVDQLTAVALGWPLPVAGLRNWLQGYATDANGGKFIASTLRNRVTTDDGWEIQYVTWQEPQAQTSSIYPKRIDLRRTTEQAGTVAIRIVIDSTDIS